MPHPNIDQVRKSHAEKLSDMAGTRGEHASERAERLAASTESAARGVPHVMEEHFTAAPARQVSDFGKVRK